MPTICSKCGNANELATKGRGKDSWCKQCRNEATAAYFRTPKGKFVNQKNGAKQRGIEWLLTFEQWWSVWRDYWDLRGHGAGKLQLCRVGDEGPYELGNVYIATHEQNVSDSWRNGKHDAG